MSLQILLRKQSLYVHFMISTPRQIRTYSLFPENILSIIQWTPIPYLVDLPVSIATGIIIGYEWIELFLYGLIWCIILTGISFFIYRIGIKDYEAFGQ